MGDAEQIEFLAAVLIVSPDPGRLAAFYRDGLGLPLRAEEHGAEPHWGCELGDVHFAIHPGEPGAGRSPVRFALWVFDLASYVAGLQRKEIPCLYPVENLGEGSWITAVQDPDGNEVELTQMGEEWVRHLAERRHAGADVLARASAQP
ncbi:MAG TPA: VOC family protein [Candidatus Dormibacteraeota bacterium]|nr:VOC family protein [Candidatus Dormibacteraeota bacterium]